MRTIAILMLLAAAAAASACSDPFAPSPWNPAPDTVLLFSAGRADLLGLPSGYDFTAAGHRRVVIERPGEAGTWDIALTDVDGRLKLLPPGALPGVNSNAAIAHVPAVPFDSLKEVPNATAQIVYDDSTAVDIMDGEVYVVRTRPVASVYGTCTFYAKLQPLVTDTTAGTLLFRYVANPNCNDPSFTSPGG